MRMPDKLLNVLLGLVGQRCTGADNPHGSVIRLDIGDLGPASGEPEHSKKHGWRHLTIQSAWRLESAEEVLASWDTSESDGEVLAERLRSLLDRKILAATAAPPAYDLAIELSGGVVLKVFCDCGDTETDCWFLLGTDGLEVGARPVFKGGGGVEITTTR